MELTKQDTQMAKGVAVLGMVMLHLFCRQGDLPYTPLLWCGDVPLIYYLGLFGDVCVPVFCFCSGYAHYLIAQNQGKQYPGRLPGKAIRFLCNYWIVVLLFSVLGLIFDKSGRIPGSLWEFLGNLLVVGMTYNGAWWFVATYLLLLMLSPIFTTITRRMNGILLMNISVGVYFLFYVLRFMYPVQFDSAAVNWIWQQIVLLGTSQLGYLMGMVCRKYELISKLKSALSERPFLRRMTVLCLPCIAFVGHCIVQSVFVAPFTAAAILMALFLAKLPAWIKNIFLLLGQHSTNIWLVHMFFYLNLFTGFAFLGRYPILILALMLGISIFASLIINGIYHPVLSLLNREKQSCETQRR